MGIYKTRFIFSDLLEQCLNILVIVLNHSDAASACGVAMASQIDKMAIKAVESKLYGCLEMVFHMLAKTMHEAD